MKGIKNEKGQSTIEFTLTLTFLLAFVFFFLQLALVFGYGNYVQYATFMSARALQSATETQDDQIGRAKAVLIRMLKKSQGASGVDRWPGIGKGVDGQDIAGADIGIVDPFDRNDPGLSWREGVRYSFRSRLFLIPLSQSDVANSITLTSESWLGREVTTEECSQFLNRFGEIIFDNGC